MIEITVPQLEHGLLPVKDAYAYNEGRPHHWLQRLCIYILDRLGCQYYHTQVAYRTARLEVDSLLDAVKDQMLAVDYTYARKCKYILVGKDAMRRLWGEAIERVVGIDTSGFQHLQELYGLKIITVPWFEGIVCLPDLERL